MAKKVTEKLVPLEIDLVDLLNEAAEDLETQLGFQPTLSQTIRHLIHQHKTTAEKERKE